MKEKSLFSEDFFCHDLIKNDVSLNLFLQNIDYSFINWFVQKDKLICTKEQT